MCLSCGTDNVFISTLVFGRFLTKVGTRALVITVVAEVTGFLWYKWTIAVLLD